MQNVSMSMQPLVSNHICRTLDEKKIKAINENK